MLLLHAFFCPRKGGELKSCEEVDLGTTITLHWRNSLICTQKKLLKGSKAGLLVYCLSRTSH